MSKTTWQIDSVHSEVEFAVKHMMISTVKGRFADVAGTIELDETDMSNSSVNVVIGAASVDTRQEQRDTHLRSADFFEVEKYPEITFRSRRVEPQGAGKLRVVGDLTIRGISREVVLDTADEGRNKDLWGGDRAGFSAQAAIDRRDFGLTWNTALETGGVLVSNEIKISLEVQAVKAVSVAAA